MTDQDVADRVYIEPLTVEVMEAVIARERPDGVLPTLGGQTGLNLAVAMADAGLLEKYQVRLLGTPIETIRNAEDRELFRKLLSHIGQPQPPSQSVSSAEEARAVAGRMGLPLVVRPAYTLGGTGGGVARTPGEFDSIVASGLAASPIRQVLLERSLLGWKEIEYEVIRDGADNCITVCNMENMDPMGVHTGDSIVVAPSQTLTDKEYQMLRSASLKIIRALGIEGGCNIQFAMPPHPVVAEALAANWDAGAPYYVIEVNPRVSRSSALASKATGYPIARVAAKIAVGKRLDEIPNAVTLKTTAAFEPALDYCVVKIPRWPFDKFPAGDRTLTTQMKATGEVMAIDRCFQAALQKAVRSLELGGRSLLWEHPDWRRQGDSLAPLTPLDSGPGSPLEANDQRLWAMMYVLRRGATPQALARSTHIDPWFCHALSTIVEMEARLLGESLTPDLMLQAKRLGFSDDQVGVLADVLSERVREMRGSWGIRPVYKMVDTCAAEFEAATPYFYSTYEEENEAPPLEGPKALVVGSGPIRIGQGIEFDYCSVHAAWALQQEGVRAIMVNSNPETVSTDFDTSHRLYFEPLDEESLRDIIDNETQGDNEAQGAPGRRGRRPGGNVVSCPGLGGPVRRADGHKPVPESGTGRPASSGLWRRVHRRCLRPPEVRGFSGQARHPPASGGGRSVGGGGPPRCPGHRVPRGSPAQLRAGRPGNGDRPERHRADSVPDACLRGGPGQGSAHRQVPGGQGVRGGRHMRRPPGAYSRGDGAHREGGGAQRRLHGHIPGAKPDRGRGGYHCGLHHPHRSGPGGQRPHERPVRDLGGSSLQEPPGPRGRGGRELRLRAGGQPQGQPHRPLHIQGDGRPRCQPGHEGDAGSDPGGDGLSRRTVEEAENSGG